MQPISRKGGGPGAGGGAAQYGGQSAFGGPSTTGTGPRGGQSRKKQNQAALAAAAAERETAGHGIGSSFAVDEQSASVSVGGTTSVMSASGTHVSKRTAQDKADGEPRQKRKRVDNSQAHAQAAAMNAASTSAQQPSIIAFEKLSTESLYKYAMLHELVPVIYPTPLGIEDPPVPLALLDPLAMRSRAASPDETLAFGLNATGRNRRQQRQGSREPAGSNRRRSTRLLDDGHRLDGQKAVLADVGEIHGVLAQLAERHHREEAVKEVDTLASFMCAVHSRRLAGTHSQSFS